MGFEGKIYGPGEEPPNLLTRDKGAHKFNPYFYTKIGMILDVDPDRYEMQISWYGERGEQNRIPISFPYAGPASFMGMLPEYGALGLFGFYDEGDGKGSPICLGYLPSGLATGLDFNNVKITPDSVPNSGKNEILHRFRKLQQGKMNIVSPDGAGVVLSADTEISDSRQDKIIIRHGDQAIISTSRNNHIFCDGVSISSGPIIRNGLMLYDRAGAKIDNNGSSILLPSGKEQVYIVPGGRKIKYDSKSYTEYRVEVEETGDGNLDVNDINGEENSSPKKPIVKMILGNYVGTDENDRETYGHPLRPSLFSDDDDTFGDFQLIRATQDTGINEPETLGLAYALHFESSAFIGVDKQGQLKINLPSSTADPASAGRSMSLLATGGLKEIWGPASATNNSWDLTAKGGIRWNVGAHNGAEKNRSIDIRTDSGVYFEYGGNDDDGYAKTELVLGNTLNLGGNVKTEVGSQDTTIAGLKTENVMGSESQTVQSDKTVNVMSVYTEIVLKEKQQRYGKRKTTITFGNDELTVVKGDIKETIQIYGNKSTSILAGNIEEKIVAGNRETSIVAGSYGVSVTTGKIEMSTAAGIMKLSAGAMVDISSSAILNIDAPIIQIGSPLVGGAISGLPGKPSHFDYMTGVPLKGSTKVSIG